MKKEVEDKIQDLQKSLDGENQDEIKQKTQELSQAIQKIGAQMYGQGQQNQGDEKKNDKPDNDKPGDTDEGEFKKKE